MNAIAEAIDQGRAVRTVVPRALILPLEEYLQHHRAVLLKGREPRTLFVSDDGHALTRQQVTDLVGRITRRYAGRRVTPHLFRDIFAVYWLKRYPSEITIVSRALWHKSIETTSRKYAWAFDASHALTRIEEHFESERELSVSS